MKKDMFFKAANKITQAGEYLLGHGYKASQVVEISQAFLSLMMVESRIIRSCRKKALDTALDHFNDYGHSMILKGLKVSQEKKMTEKQIIEVAARNKVVANYFNNVWVNQVMASLLTFAAIGYEAEEEEKNKQGEEYEQIQA